MRKYLVTASCACLLYLSLSPALAITNEANFIREYRAKAVQAQFNNRYEEAIGHYQQAVDLATQTYGANSPFVGEIYYDMGSLALTNSQFKNAEEWLEQSVKLNPNSSGGRLRLAELEALRGRTDEAVRQASLVVAKHKDDPVAHQQLAIALDKNGDGLKSLREFAVSEQLARVERMRADGRAPSKPLISIPPIWQAPKAAAPTEPVQKDDAKAEAEMKKKAAADAKKAADDAKKLKTEMAKIEALQKAEAKKADASRKAELKKQQDAKRAADAAKIAKAKAAQAAAKKAAAALQAASDAKPITGMKANLTSKAVLLTPVGKKPAAAQSTSTEVVKPAAKPLKAAEPKFDETAETPEEEVAKPVPKKVVKPAEPAKPAVIKPIKPMKGGLVPPPPPVIPTMQMMVAPPPPVPVAKPKAAAPKKEEKPKVETPKEEKPATHHDAGAGGADDDDFLLDWGGAKGKKK